ncbi:hypothetical protein EPN95_01915 [Patescibacteria group bacterium]|nr:MAG: hypothetical protein EPN95_01915 [Patescibacteria group bacterium]
MNLLSQLANNTSPVVYDYAYRYGHTDTVIAPAVIATILFVGFIIFLVIYALHAFLLSRIFKKAGVSQAIAWIPFYNTWKFLELGDQQGFWSILTVIPFVNYVADVFVFIAMYKIGLKLGKDGVWVVLAIFLPTVWMAILAFDNSKWHTKAVK